jgi:DNA modification methylase
VPCLIQLFNDKFENVLPKIKFDVIITDPPYPDYLADEYGYYDGIIDWCKNFDCRQLIFWSAKAYNAF